MSIEPVLTLLRLPLRTVPDSLHALVLTRVVNRLLRRQPLASRLVELEGRSIGVHIKDTDTRLNLRIVNGELTPADHPPPLVVIRGDLRDFIALATRAEDPDTLFFHRRLSIEGDVDTGLHVKNLLDTFDYDFEAPLRRWLPPPAADTVLRLAQRVRDWTTVRR